MPEMKIIAHIESDFTEKFGIPRQSGLVEDLVSRIVFEKEYRVHEAFRGLEDFSHIWIIWQFSEAVMEDWSPTVRPPRLGGNKRMGVFATRSPFRPNSIGLSSVKLLKIDFDCPEAPVLYVSGADMLNGTPIFDIKPYLPYTDSHPEASGGFALQQKEGVLEVDFPPKLLEKVRPELRNGLIEVLAQDPRPQYQNSPERVYTFDFAEYSVSFTVRDNTLYVSEIK
ncbi:MAG: tRNA (N6-threonylcarbamoyladenosine(37)-N6)-methyltransferase TrmO [Oscillospiraceae bacterium]|nr:tRNA (N6-threonylcarbamoyladenosine(37)-N6)-methyltransferase TrmO [Oscillospiraceae bacterium]